jgi:hypothetical protein
MTRAHGVAITSPAGGFFLGWLIVTINFILNHCGFGCADAGFRATRSRP